MMHLSNGVSNYNTFIGHGLNFRERDKLYSCSDFSAAKELEVLFSFYRLSSRVLKQIKESEGAINYAVKGNPLKKHFWTLSIWRDNNSLGYFIMEEPHATAVRKFTEWAGEGSAFVEWTSPSNTIDWPEALKKLERPAYYYKK
jgi:hypothetical protein